MSLKPCPCGKTPEALSFNEGYSSKYGFVTPTCCGEWHIEFRTGYNQIEERNLPALERLMEMAWNDAPRPEPSENEK